MCKLQVVQQAADTCTRRPDSTESKQHQRSPDSDSDRFLKCKQAVVIQRAKHQTPLAHLDSLQPALVDAAEIEQGLRGDAVVSSHSSCISTSDTHSLTLASRSLTLLLLHPPAAASATTTSAVAGIAASPPQEACHAHLLLLGSSAVLMPAHAAIGSPVP